MTAASPLSRLVRLGLAATALAGLSACNLLTRMSEVGSGPEVSRIENPTQKQGYQPITMPMPQPVAPPQAANSLWRPGARAFFKDQRAKDVGDILTVAVSIDESADVETALGNSRVGAESESIAALAGLESTLTKILPAGASASNLGDITSSSTVTNSGKTTRIEKITMNLATTITQVLPNGNLVISG
ncbi:MAG: hypothetical protein RLZZ501_1476, partial [Pseudomonadota bacterium]